MTEPWLRGPVAGVNPLLQPPVHALMLAREDIAAAVAGLTPEQLWKPPVDGAPSVGFHLLHVAGSTDRLLTYARGKALSPAQLRALSEEEQLPEPRPALATLLERWDDSVENALMEIAATPESILTDARAVGRSRLPSTVSGLLFHLAEHAARHAGQIVTTAKIIRGQP